MEIILIFNYRKYKNKFSILIISVLIFILFFEDAGFYIYSLSLVFFINIFYSVVISRMNSLYFLRAQTKMDKIAGCLKFFARAILR